MSPDQYVANAQQDSALRRVVAALDDSAILHRLSVSARGFLAQAGGSISLEAGATLCQAGDAGDAVYVILEGALEVVNRTPGGRDVRLAAFGEGEIVGEMAVLDGGPRSADMVATRRCRLWRIPRSALTEVLESEPRAAMELIAELCRRLRNANSALEASTRLDLGGRLARLLLAEKGSHGQVALTQTEIARRLNVSREKVNRRLHQWADEGHVTLSTAGIRVNHAGHLSEVIASALGR